MYRWRSNLTHIYRIRNFTEYDKLKKVDNSNAASIKDVVQHGTKTNIVFKNTQLNTDARWSTHTHFDVHISYKFFTRYNYIFIHFYSEFIKPNLMELNKPKVKYCVLPGGLKYLEVRSPGLKLPHYYLQYLKYNVCFFFLYKPNIIVYLSFVVYW